MKKFSYLLVSAIIIGGILPSLVFASWWNPFSWFKTFDSWLGVKKERIEVKPAVDDSSSGSKTGITTQEALSMGEFKSPAGFSIRYPSSWAKYERKAVDSSLQSVSFYFPGNVDSNNLIQQQFSVIPQVALGQFILDDLALTYSRDLQKRKLYNTKIIDEKYIKIGRARAYEVVYEEKDIDSGITRNVIKILMPADDTNFPGRNTLGFFIEFRYFADPEHFDRNLAETIAGSFKDNILSTYIGQQNAKRIDKADTPKSDSIKPYEGLPPVPQIINN